MWKYALVVLISLGSSHPLFAQAPLQTKRSFVENTAQVGLEYDDNIFKTFDSGVQDAALRLLLTTKKNFLRPRSLFGLALQAGGKKYFSHAEQDTLIGQLDIQFQTERKQKVKFGLSTNVKGQLENNSLDDAQIDINEDFLSSHSKVNISYPVFLGLSQTIFTKFIYFAFFGDLAIDFFEEQVGTSFSRRIAGPFAIRAGYDFSLLQFPNSTSGDRDDQQHEISAAINYYGPFLLSLGYAYIDNNSSQDIFSSTGHKVTALLSFAFYSSERYKEIGEDITLHLLGTLQVRSFPAVFISDAEGQRLLFSDAEDNNFNTLTIKITKRFSQRFTLEGKYSRYSNELSDREDPFSRNLFVLGLRATF